MWNEWKGSNLKGSDVTFKIKNFIKKYLPEKYHYKCSKCGWGEKTNLQKNPLLMGIVKITMKII